MRAIQKIQTFIESSPESFDAQAFAHLILSLQAEAELSSSDLYKLNAEHFDLAMELLRDWRIDRFYRGRAKAFNLDSTPP
jgi:pantothenate kinase